MYVDRLIYIYIYIYIYIDIETNMLIDKETDK